MTTTTDRTPELPTGSDWSGKIRAGALFLIVAVNLAFWLVPSPVARLISKGKPVLLGRYSVERMSTLLLLIPLSLVALWLITARRETLKPRLFKTALMLFTLILALPLVDLALRINRQARYQSTPQGYHRPPGQYLSLTVRDHSQPGETMPGDKPGYPEFACRLTTDARGFRNPNALDRCDVLCLGDSFTEGSLVSDEDIWPARLATHTGMAVYNLGMSGSSPIQYLQNFRGVGISLRPRFLVCLLYEGNDFRETQPAAVDAAAAAATPAAGRPKLPWRKRLRSYLRSSPFRLEGKRWLISAFGGDAGAGSAAQIPGLGWLPFGWPQDENGKYYSFKTKYFQSFYATPPRVPELPGWQTVVEVLEHLQEECRSRNIVMFVAYAPTAANVLLPRIAATVPPAEFHAFMRLEKGNLPPPERLFPEMLACADTIEQAVAEFCARQGIGFISLKAKLRKETDRGRQCYFTYDQHWTPEGHALVAEIIAARLREAAASTSTP